MGNELALRFKKLVGRVLEVPRSQMDVSYYASILFSTPVLSSMLFVSLHLHLRTTPTPQRCHSNALQILIIVAPQFRCIFGPSYLLFPFLNIHIIHLALGLSCCRFNSTRKRKSPLSHIAAATTSRSSSIEGQVERASGCRQQ